jgi:hypothetical protein
MAVDSVLSGGKVYMLRKYYEPPGEAKTRERLALLNDLSDRDVPDSFGKAFEGSPATSSSWANIPRR